MKISASAPLRILVVDDDLDQVQMLALLFKQMGHHVDYAINCSFGLEHASSARYDVYVLDLNLPDGIGLGLTRDIRKLPDAESSLVIGITGMSVDRQAARLSGMDHLLAKPINIAQLETLLAQRKS